MVAHLGCTSRGQCRQTNARFNRMEADLHNLFPARSGTNRARSDRTFGEVAGEPREFGTTCGFEVDIDNDVAEPPPGARGDVARAIFYMHQEYGLRSGGRGAVAAAESVSACGHGHQLQATARDIAIIAEAATIVANLGVSRRRNQRKRRH